MTRTAGRRRSRAALALLAALLLVVPARAEPGGGADPKPARPPVTVERICELIAIEAARNGLPEPFFARLIWKESRFDPGALSPAGAEGIAQFMPGTAALRGLADSYDIEQALPASAKYLGELKLGFGNLGLAAAAYNAGEARVRRWLAAGGLLPLETENYVLDILGEPADSFSDPAHQGTVPALHPQKTFREACAAMPAILSEIIAMASVHTKPWGIQVAGGFRRAAAMRQWQRLEARNRAVLASHEPVISRLRSARGRAGIYAVRIGADTRPEADRICAALRKSGGSCVVLRNR